MIMTFRIARSLTHSLSLPLSTLCPCVFMFACAFQNFLSTLQNISKVKMSSFPYIIFFFNISFLCLFVFLAHYFHHENAKRTSSLSFIYHLNEQHWFEEKKGKWTMHNGQTGNYYLRSDYNFHFFTFINYDFLIHILQTYSACSMAIISYFSW